MHFFSVFPDILYIRNIAIPSPWMKKTCFHLHDTRYCLSTCLVGNARLIHYVYPYCAHKIMYYYVSTRF